MRTPAQRRPGGAGVGGGRDGQQPAALLPPLAMQPATSRAAPTSSQEDSLHPPSKSSSSPRLFLPPLDAHQATNDVPFSPTHFSPTSSSPSSAHLPPNVGLAPSSRSLFTSFGAISLKEESSPPSLQPFDDVNTAYASLPRPPPASSLSPRLHLPSIQTTFGQRTSANASSLRGESSNQIDFGSRHDSAGPTHRLGPAFSAATNAYDSPLTNSTTTPSSIGVHHLYHFSPAAQRGGEFSARSPATSYGGSDLQHGHGGQTQQSEVRWDTLNKEEPSLLRSSAQGWRSDWPGFQSGLHGECRAQTISPAMLAARLSHCRRHPGQRSANSRPALGTPPSATSRLGSWSPATTWEVQQLKSSQTSPILGTLPVSEKEGADARGEKGVRESKGKLDQMDGGGADLPGIEARPGGTGISSRGINQGGEVGKTGSEAEAQREQEPASASASAVWALDTGKQPALCPSPTPLPPAPLLSSSPLSSSRPSSSPRPSLFPAGALGAGSGSVAAAASGRGESSGSPAKTVVSTHRPNSNPTGSTAVYPLPAPLHHPHTTLALPSPPLPLCDTASPSITATGRPVRGLKTDCPATTTTTTASSSSSFDTHNPAIPLLLYVTTHQGWTSKEVKGVLDRLEAVHIDLPSEVVRRRCQGGADCSTFEELEAFVVGEMSKRRYSAFIMDEAADGEWTRDIVIVTEERDGGLGSSLPETRDVEQSLGSANYDEASTAGNASLAGISARMLADAIQELASVKGERQRASLFHLEGGPQGLQAVLEAETKQDGGLLTVEPAALMEAPASPMTPTRPRRSGTLRPVKSLTLTPPLGSVHSASATIHESPAQLATAAHLMQGSTLAAPPAPPPSRTTRPSRPMLTRLDTSERVNGVAPLRRVSSDSPRLALNTIAVPATASVDGDNSGSDEALVGAQAREMRRESEPGGREQRIGSAIAKSLQSAHSPTRSFSLSSGTALTASFEPSEIICNFLYLGPDISTMSEVDYLKNHWGIKRILNAAWEIEDGGGRHLNLQDEALSGIERYKKLPLKDTVEAKGVAKSIEEACAFLDDARLHSAPVYVHCKAGKSRSVMLVMAYLIHANRWTLQQSYAYVVERRRSVSPNLGFVAELMAFEERRLQTSKANGSVDWRTGSGSDSGDGSEERQGEQGQGKRDGEGGSVSLGKKANRESLPTTVALALAPLPFWEQMHAAADEKEGGEEGWPKEASAEEPASTAAQLATMTSSGEYRGSDGRYYAKRPPADAKLLAPNRRATLAAVDSANIFGVRRLPQE